MIRVRTIAVQLFHYSTPKCIRQKRRGILSKLNDFPRRKIPGVPNVDKKGSVIYRGSFPPSRKRDVARCTDNLAALAERNLPATNFDEIHDGGRAQ